MTKSDRNECIRQGLVVRGSLLFGSANTSLRREMSQAGCVYHSQTSQWVFPDRATLERFIPRISGAKPVAARSGFAEAPSRRSGNGNWNGQGKSNSQGNRNGQGRSNGSSQGKGEAQQAAPAMPPVPPPPGAGGLPPAPPPPPPSGGAGGLPPAPPPPPAVPPVPGTPEVAKGKGLKKLKLPPSIVVCGSVEVLGKVRYRRLDEQSKVLGEQGSIRIKEVIKTSKKVIENVDEYETAQKLAGELRYAVRKLAQATILGPVCPPDKEPALDAVITDARVRARAFNEVAVSHMIRVAYVKATISSDDESAAREFTYDFQQYLGDMKVALEALDVKQIRNVAAQMQSTIKGLSAMIPAQERSILQKAVDNARAQARMIVEEVGAKGRTIESVKEELETSAVDAARMTFLEYEVSPELQNLTVESVADSARFSEMEVESDEASLLRPVSQEKPASTVDNGRFSDL